MLRIFRCRKEMFLLLLSFYGAFVGTTFGQTDVRPTATWLVQQYDLVATLPQVPTDRSLSVKAVLQLKNVTQRPAPTLSLRIGSTAEILATTLNGSPVEFTKSEEKLGAASSLQRILIRVPSVAAGASVAVTIDYKFAVKDNSGVSSISPVGAQFLPNAFWYPTPNSWYFPRGADFAPLRLQVRSAGQSTVVSSGAEVGGTYDQKLKVQPFFVVGDWEKIAGPDNVSIYVLKSSGADKRARAAAIGKIAADAKSFMSSLLGPLPDTPIRLVAVKRGGGFSNGGTFLFDESVLRRSKIDAATATNIADGFAKIWLGNSVEVSGDGFGVIREGLSKYLATQFVESSFGKDVADVERLRQLTAYSTIVYRDAPLTIVSPLDDYYYPEVGNKGAMVWRLVEKRIGRDEMLKTLKSSIANGSFELANFRAANSAQKEFLDYMFDQITDMNLQAGLPQIANGDTKVAVRNSGSIDANVNVAALMASGEKMIAPVTIRAKSYGEVIFKTSNKIARVEIDPEKFYPQTDYSDDVAPREFTDSDLLLAVKRSFDKQGFAAAEKSGSTILRDFPRFDDVRILLARSLLAQNKIPAAEREFQAILDEKLPTARSLAWANVGLADVALKAGKSADAVNLAQLAIAADADYGASLAARAIRNRANSALQNDESIKAFFAHFDKAVISNRKAEVDALTTTGDVNRFVSGISGQATEWKTQIVQIDKFDGDTALVETNLNVKLLNKDPESGMAVFRLVRTSAGWKLYSVDMFEVRRAETQ